VTKEIAILLSICLLCGCSEVFLPQEKSEPPQTESSASNTENEPIAEEPSSAPAQEESETIAETSGQWQYISASENHVIIEKEFYPVEGNVLVMRMEIPSDWKYSSESPSIDDANDLKVCEALGLIAILDEGETLEDLENPEGMPFPLESSIQSIGERTYLLTEGVAEDSRIYNSRIYSFCFIEDGCLINIHFYNIGDSEENMDIFYKVLDSIEVEITKKSR